MNQNLMQKIIENGSLYGKGNVTDAQKELVVSFQSIAKPENLLRGREIHNLYDKFKEQI